jgi:hypothetical protein
MEAHGRADIELVNFTRIVPRMVKGAWKLG